MDNNVPHRNIVNLTVFRALPEPICVISPYKSEWRTHTFIVVFSFWAMCSDENILRKWNRMVQRHFESTLHQTNGKNRSPMLMGNGLGHSFAHSRIQNKRYYTRSSAPTRTQRERKQFLILLLLFLFLASIVVYGRRRLRHKNWMFVCVCVCILLIG